MEKNAFLKVLQDWSGYSEKYLRKTYIENKIKNFSQDSTYTLKITFQYSDKRIENNLTIDDYEHLTSKDLNDKLLELEEPFYEEVSKFAEEKWLDIDKEALPINEEIDLLIFFPTMDIEDGKIIHYRTYIIVTGKYIPPNIITNDNGLNFELSRGNMRVIHWNYI